MLRHRLTFARYPVLGFPLWVLALGLAFVWLVDWATGGRLSH